MTEQKLEHPVGEEGEFITRCSVGRLFTEKAIRGMSTECKKAIFSY